MTHTPAKRGQADLVPLPMRITRRQLERLREARGTDGLAVQEHVRRALDAYLDKLSRAVAVNGPASFPVPARTGAGTGVGAPTSVGSPAAAVLTRK